MCNEHPIVRLIRMRTHFAWTIACTLAIAVACGAQSVDTTIIFNVATADSLVFERTACFGTCPTYRVRISRDGAVHLRWQAQRPNRAVTERDWTIPADSVRALFALAAEGGITALPDRISESRTYCPQAWTDMPGAIVSFYGAGWSKTTDDYFGCKQAPPALRAFEIAIDSVAGVHAHAPS